ncbi:MAG: fumarylacetoacetate hydrolase family protein [Bdellovibrionales bacterium]|nr:fumarylacetoacetate hydrolase family protein [Bdellovibrionales bacterium]
MKLATIKSSSKDGKLIVVSKDNKNAVEATDIANNLRQAIEDWTTTSPKLKSLYQKLNSGQLDNSFKLDESKLHSPMPRTFQWADGSAFIHHIKLVRQARGAALPETLTTIPLMYQGGGDDFISPTEDILQVDPSHGTDFEGEVGVIVDDVPMGVSPKDALNHVKLIVLINDVSLRGLIPSELKSGFGFFHGKPSSSFAPFALTPDELGSAWEGGRLNLPLLVEYNDQFFGKANASAMHFDFGELISHAAKTRNLKAGAIIGSGTVSNEDMSCGSSCLAEKRMLEKIHEGVIKTSFMSDGDQIKIEMKNELGENLFGSINQKVRKI